jgi:hypothetical protein
MEVEAIMLPVDELVLLGGHVDVGNMDDDELEKSELELNGFTLRILESETVEEILECDGVTL